MRFIDIGLGIGAIAIVGGFMNIFPQSCWLPYLLVGLGVIIFCWCGILEIYESKNSRYLKSFIHFLDKVIIEGQELMDSYLQSHPNTWIQNKADMSPLQDFEIRYKKWREKINKGCQQALGGKKQLPFNRGQIPQLSFAWGDNDDYRKYLEQDIQNLKDFRILIHKGDVIKKI